MILAISCSSDSFITLFKVIASFIRILYVLVVVGLVVYTMIDFAKVVMSEKVDSGAAFKTFSKKLISTVLVFLMIPIVVFVMDVFTSNLNSDSIVGTCTEVIFSGLRNPGSLVTSDDTEPEDNDDAAARLSVFKDSCDRLGGDYQRELLANYDYSSPTVVDYYDDGEYMHLCKYTGQ